MKHYLQEIRLKSTGEFHGAFFLPYLSAVFSGILLSASFPDPDLGLLGFIALVPFLTGMSFMDRGQAFSSGMIMGLVHYTTLLYWIVPTLCRFGGLWLPASISTLLLLSLYLSLYPGMFALAWKILDPGPGTAPLTGACLWTLLEIIRSYLFTGFPWGALGYSQYKHAIILQTADLFGVSGISFVIVWINVFLALICQSLRSTDGFHPKGAMLVTTLTTLLLCAAVWGYGRYKITRTDHLLARAPRIPVSVIQGNIGETQKWDPSMIPHAIEIYEQLSLKAAQTRPGLIIWPETALPFLYKQETLYSQKIDACIRRAGTYFLIGSLHITPPPNTGSRLRNRAIMLSPQAISTGYHDKHHLVPFGEYIPLEPVLGRLGKLIAQAGNFSPGSPELVPLSFFSPREASSASQPEYASYSAGVLICFESLFPALSRRFVLNHGDILAIITNDAWFGRTSAPAQHFSLAVLRAVENRRSVARAANTGISGFIDPAGRILEQTRMDEQTFLTASIPVVTELTIYTRYPFVLALGATLALLAVIVLHIKIKT